MNLDTVLARLKAAEFKEILQPWWDDAMRSFPAGCLHFLEPAVVAVHREWCGFPAEDEPVLLETARRIAGDPALSRLAWYYYWNQFEYDGRGWTRVPALKEALEGRGPTLLLLVAMAIVPRMRAHHQALGVPESVTRQTCRQVYAYCLNYERGCGVRFGIYPGQFGWLRNYFRRNLYFRLGRFEYWAEASGEGYRVFRHRTTRQVVALADAGVSLDRDGIPVPAGGEPVPGAWTTTLQEDAASVKGYPISPRGYVLGREVTLSRAEWECVLGKGDPVLSMHIPSGGNMTLDLCAESFRYAVSFFREHFPDRAPVAITCRSWMFSSLLEQILPAEANLVRFERELYLHPFAGQGPNGPWFVFLQSPFDLKTAPRKTSLQRAIAGYLDGGRLWRDGGMFFLADDLPQFGRQCYRTAWPFG